MKYFYQILIHVNLYINTSGKYCELALFQDHILKQSRIHQQAMEHSTVLHDLIRELLQDAKISLKDLSSIALLNGPGSYTGLRIGLAAAKGFCYALDIPLILFNKISLSCSYYRSIHQNIDVLAYLEPARQGEYFFGLENEEEELLAPLVQRTDFILEQFKVHPNAEIISSKTDVLFEDLHIKPKFVQISYDFIGSCITKRLINKDFDDLYRSEPFYLKKVHANKAKKRF